MFGAPRITSSDLLLVDLHGRPVADRIVTGASMAKARQWVLFLDEWAPVFQQSQPWVTFAVTAVVNVHQGIIVLAKRLRKNADWSGHASTLAADTVRVEEDAEGRLAWFERESEQIDQRLLPPWALFLFAALQGAFRTLVRVAKECAQIQRKGHLIVPIDRAGEVVEEARELDEGVEAER